MAQAPSPGTSSGKASSGKTLFFFEKPSAMRQVQRFFRSPSTVCVAAEGHLLEAAEPGEIRPDWKPWRFDALPIALDRLPVGPGHGRSGQSHAPKLAAIRQALQGVERVIIATDPGREGSMIAWEVLEHLGWHGRVDRLKLGALDEVSIRRAFAALAKDPDSGERDYAAYLEALCRQYEDYHLGLNGTRAISLRLRPPAFREPWRFGGVQTPTLAILADLEERIRTFVPRDFYKIALPVTTESGASLTLEAVHLRGEATEHVAEAGQIAFGRLQPQLGFVTARVQARDAGRILQDAAALLGLSVDDLADLAVGQLAGGVVVDDHCPLADTDLAGAGLGDRVRDVLRRLAAAGEEDPVGRAGLQRQLRRPGHGHRLAEQPVPRDRRPAFPSHPGALDPVVAWRRPRPCPRSRARASSWPRAPSAP